MVLYSLVSGYDLMVCVVVVIESSTDTRCNLHSVMVGAKLVTGSIWVVTFKDAAHTVCSSRHIQQELTRIA